MKRGAGKVKIVIPRSVSAMRSMGGRRSRDRASTPAVRTSEYTLIVLGASKVGKTALVGQFLWDGFIKEYRPTVEEFNWIEYDNDAGNAILLQVIDTSGSHDFLAMRHLYAKTGDAFIVVFAVDDPVSLDEAKGIIAEIRAQNTKKAPILLIANKTDLYESEEQWASKDSRVYAVKNELHFAAVSAINAHQVSDTFRRLLGEIGNFRPAEMKKRRQSMPSTRGNYSGIEAADIERLAKRHAAASKNSCTLS